MESIKQIFVAGLKQLQNDICTALENEDGRSRFREDLWERTGGGGGCSRIIQQGNVFEKGGVNFSEVSGLVTPVMKSQLQLSGQSFFATGLSLVIHPLNPFVPTVHANFRYFELYNEKEEVVDSWFGGGTDLTPYYLIEEDAKHFHATYKNICDAFDPNYYNDFKKQCDDYFVNAHRNNERRGIGGIFYDYKRPIAEKDANYWVDFAMACGHAFIDAYLPIVIRRKNNSFTNQHKRWQEIRRGRYVEFNLVHDRGTLFGLRTNGRTESILMSLPPTARFEYDHHPAPGSEEDKLLQVCLHPRQWV